jgi:hypothetical protein
VSRLGGTGNLVDHCICGTPTRLTKDGEGRKLLNDYRALRSVQLAYERELGMTPAARTNLKASIAHAPMDVVSAMSWSTEPEDATSTAVGKVDGGGDGGQGREE